MADRWYYTHHDAVHGPVSGAALRGLIEKGGLSPADHIWPEGGDRRQAIRADAALAFPAPVPVPLASPVAESAPSQATDWLAGLAAAVATGGDLMALPPPPAVAWLSDMRRIEQPSGRDHGSPAGAKPRTPDAPNPSEAEEGDPAAWPLSQDYNEAIQSPASNFADPDLKRGQPFVGPLGIPMPHSGNFADVYQVRCPDGSCWAVKCFTRVASGLRERYRAISRRLRRVRLPFMVDFTYLDQGIRVAGRWYPVLKMEWVEGQTPNQFLGERVNEPAVLESFLKSWARMARRLRAEEVGHCDLQHGNILLTPGDGTDGVRLKLIDYDGMWVPELAGRSSGEVGHPAYQHPQRLREGTYSLDVDRFPLLLIATALRAWRSTAGRCGTAATPATACCFARRTWRRRRSRPCSTTWSGRAIR